MGVPVAKSDGAGLTFTLSKAGTASWVLRYMREAKAKELTIGNYPDISLAAARKTARARRVEIDGGLDPAATKKVARAHTKMAWTVNALATDYALKKLVPAELSEETIYARNWDFDNVIRPKLGTLEVRKVTPMDVVDMLEKSKRTWTMQRRFLTSATMLFDHAVGKQLVLVNPCVGIKLTSLLGKRPAIRKRVMLSENELRSLLSGIDEIGTENALAFRVLLATCVRSSELTKAQWVNVNLDAGTWYIPDEVVKTRIGFLVPLTPTVIGWFRALRVLSEGSIWVLPSRNHRRPGLHISKATLRAAIERMFLRGGTDIRRFTPHDTRSTAKGHMRNLGVSREISELALNHVLKGMEGIYDVREEIPERRVALEKWAAFIVACEAGIPWNVVSIDRAQNVA